MDLPTPSASHGSPSDSGISNSPKDTDMSLPFDFMIDADSLSAPSFLQANDHHQSAEACHDWANATSWPQPTGDWGWAASNSSSSGSGLETPLDMFNDILFTRAPDPTMAFLQESIPAYSFSFNPIPQALPPPATLSPPFLHFQSPNGRELTPAPSPPLAPSDGKKRKKMEDSVPLEEEIARRAREAAGVHEAVSTSASISRTSSTSYIPPYPTSSNKLPIPRLNARVAIAPKPTPPGKQPTPPASNYSSPEPSPPVEQKPPLLLPTTTSATGRVKTPHTTIERRYRTNLNARIQALKNAVPALRVLEVRKAGGIEDPMDIVDSRGFVDGVKVARKSSKANVLGKAVEYIRVLKKRENRLKRESEGLKKLLTGLVGGAGLLAEWERAWREQYGGEEMDEVEGEAEEASDDDDQDSEDEKPKKRAKLNLAEGSITKKKATSPPSLSPPADGFKRKRGRPRKVVSPPLDESLAMQYHTQHLQPQPTTYLLATFLFFSFFKSPSTPAPSAHQHSGSVLNPEPIASTSPLLLGYELSPQAMAVSEMLHTLVSFLLLCSLIMPFLPKAPSFLRHLTLSAPGSSTPTVKDDLKSTANSPDPLVAALAERSVFEETNLRKALGVHANGTGIFSVLKVSVQAALGRVMQLRQVNGSERSAWLRLAELEVLKGENASLFPRIHTYISFTECMTATASATDFAIAAFLIAPLGPGTAQGLWKQAQAISDDNKTAIEKVVLALDLDDALQILNQFAGSCTSPLQIIASMMTTTKMKQFASALFVQAVLGSDSLDKEEPFTEQELYMQAGKELGDRVAKVVSQVGHFLGSPSLSLLGCDTSVASESESDPDSSDNSVDDQSIIPSTIEETMTILHALRLYQKLFPDSSLSSSESSSTAIPSPPPSPTVNPTKSHLTLRRALASSAFDGDGDVDDARDKVVDLLADLDTRRRESART